MMSDMVADAIRRRRHRGKNFSIVAVSEGALALEDTIELARLKEETGSQR
jgi:ATP-dependent phosphofructokinase / diphosphate-dependent phosphofructokinase